MMARLSVGDKNRDTWMLQRLTVKKILRFYGKIPGIWLPVLLPLIFGRLPVKHF